MVEAAHVSKKRQFYFIQSFACSFEAFKLLGRLAKGQIFPAPKICPVAGTQALRVRSFVSRRPKRYLTELARRCESLATSAGRRLHFSLSQPLKYDKIQN